MGGGGGTPAAGVGAGRLTGAVKMWTPPSEWTTATYLVVKRLMKSSMLFVLGEERELLWFKSYGWAAAAACRRSPQVGRGEGEGSLRLVARGSYGE